MKINAEGEGGEGWAVTAQVRVVRGGKERSISTYDLLVGDVLLIDTGDILPADGLLFESSNLRYGLHGA